MINKEKINAKFIMRIVFLSVLIVILLTQTQMIQLLIKGFTPLLTAFFLAYILDYIVKFFVKRLHIKRNFSILLTIILFLSLLVLLGALIAPSIINTTISIINAVGDINFDINNLFDSEIDNELLKSIQDYLFSIINPIINQISDSIGTAILSVLGSIQEITSKLLGFIMSFIIAIYMLIEKNDLSARLKRTLYAYVPKNHSDRSIYILTKADYIFKAFVIGKAIDSFVIGVLCGITLKVIGVHYYFLIACIVGITNMIPYFGPFLGAIPAALITFIGNTSDPFLIVWVLLVILILQQLDGWVIGPYILGDTIGVSAFWIIVAVTVGGALFGIPGMFLGVPFVILIKTLVEENVEEKLTEKGLENLELNNIKEQKRLVNFKFKLK